MTVSEAQTLGYARGTSWRPDHVSSDGTEARQRILYKNRNGIETETQEQLDCVFLSETHFTASDQLLTLPRGQVLKLLL